MKYLLAMLLLSVAVLAVDPIPSTRLPSSGSYVGLVGVNGGIPNRTTFFTNFSTSATMASINAAIAACPSNQVVGLTNGTFSSLGATDMLLAKNGVTVRGNTNASGLPTTIFDFATGAREVAFKASDWFTDVGTGTARTVSSGKTRGSSTVTLTAAPTGLTVGTLIVMSGTATGTAIDGDGDDFNFATTDPYYVMHKVTAISGSDVSFEPPINADYLASSTVRIHYRTFADQVVMSGIENVVFQVTGSGFFSDHVIQMDGLDSCWLLNCKADGLDAAGSLNAHLYGHLCFRLEIRHCEVTRANSNASATYCIGIIGASSCLVVDNYFHDIANVWPILGGGGNAYAYNYFDNEIYSSPTFLSQIVFLHGSHVAYMLFEGNWVAAHYNDGVADGNETHSANCLYFRERILGWDRYPNSGTGKEVNLNCLTFRNYHNNVTVAGCVLGTTGKQTDGVDSTDANTGALAIYNIEATTRTTLIKTNNYNLVNNAVPAGEALSGGQTLVNSYLYSSKPAWFGNRTWPWVDPQSTSTSLALTTFTNFPAGYRASFSADPPADSQSTFTNLVVSGNGFKVTGNGFKIQ